MLLQVFDKFMLCEQFGEKFSDDCVKMNAVKVGRYSNQADKTIPIAKEKAHIIMKNSSNTNLGATIAQTTTFLCKIVAHSTVKQVFKDLTIR
jgi:hypothetical protein